MHLAWLLVRTAGVFALLGVAIWCMRRSNGPKVKAAETVELVGSKRLARNASVAVVRIGERTYALGVTEKAVTLLTEAELPSPEPASPERQPQPAAGERANPTFAAALADSVRQLAGRRAVTPLELPAAAEPEPEPEREPAPAPAPSRRRVAAARATTGTATTATARTTEKPATAKPATARTTAKPATARTTAKPPTAKPATAKSATATAAATTDEATTTTGESGPAPRKRARTSAAKAVTGSPAPDATDGATTTTRRSRAAARPTSEEPSCPTPRRSRAAASASLAS